MCVLTTFFSGTQGNFTIFTYKAGAGAGSLSEKMDTLFNSPSAFQIPLRTEAQSGDTVSLTPNICQAPFFIKQDQPPGSQPPCQLAARNWEHFASWLLPTIGKREIGKRVPQGPKFGKRLNPLSTRS